MRAQRRQGLSPLQARFSLTQLSQLFRSVRLLPAAVSGSLAAVVLAGSKRGIFEGFRWSTWKISGALLLPKLQDSATLACCPSPELLLLLLLLLLADLCIFFGQVVRSGAASQVPVWGIGDCVRIRKSRSDRRAVICVFLCSLDANIKNQNLNGRCVSPETLSMTTGPFMRL